MKTIETLTESVEQFFQEQKEQYERALWSLWEKVYPDTRISEEFSDDYEFQELYSEPPQMVLDHAPGVQVEAIQFLLIDGELEELWIAHKPFWSPDCVYQRVY